MKKLFYLFIALSFIISTSCDKEQGTETEVAETRSVEITATSSTTWHYFSFNDSTEVGTGEETDADNATWFARTDWDIAICRYKVRTNSGTSTSVGAKGGLYTCADAVNFSSLTMVPEMVAFVADTIVTSSGMSGTTSISESTAQVIQFQMNDDGSMVMPPVYLKSPVYLFKSANGEEIYKVNFTQYQNSEGTIGYVKFDYAALN